VDVVLGIDLGTTEAKAGLFASDGRPVALERHPYPMLPGPPGSAEQDPGAWWQAIVASVRALPTGHHRIAGVCGVAQGPTLVVVDETGRHLRPAITWLDRRPAAEAADPVDAPPDEGGRAGFGLDASIAWLANHERETFARARWLIPAWDWLSLRLSGVATGSRQRGEPDPAAGHDHRVPLAVPVGTVVGGLAPETAADLGIPAGVPVIAGVNDGTATILGSGLTTPGQAVDTGGASGGLAVYADRPLDVAGIFCAPAPLRGRWVVGGAMAATGASLEWLRGRVLDGRWTFEKLIDDAAATPPGADGLVFLPYLAGERSPIWDPAARGVLFGLTLEHGRGHIVRAVLEGAAFALRDVALPIREHGIEITELRLAGRPARSRIWAQIKADVLDVPVGLLPVPEASLLGAAILAATGAGAQPDLESAVAGMVRVVERIDPRPEHAETYDRRFAVYRSLYPRLRDVFGDLGATPRER
jgi:xylulokinase